MSSSSASSLQNISSVIPDFKSVKGCSNDAAVNSEDRQVHIVNGSFHIKFYNRMQDMQPKH